MKLIKPNPVHHTLSPDWKYIGANKTDVAKTFKRYRDRLAAEAKLKPSKIRELRTK